MQSLQSLRKNQADVVQSPFKASVIIPTLNRCDELRHVLGSVYRQDVPVEVFVMDDGSTDDTCKMVSEEFPQARLFVGEERRGPTYRRNLAAQHAESPILVTLDDDCRLVSNRTISQAIARFDCPMIGAVSLPFINVLRDSIVHTAAPDSDRCYVGAVFWGGMVAFRRDVFTQVGGYRSSLFMQGEEGDLLIRMMNAGYVLRIGDFQPLHHYESPVRDLSRRHQLGPRNQVQFAWRNVPMPYFVSHMCGTLLKGNWHGIRRGGPVKTSLAYIKGLLTLPSIRTERQPVRASVYRVYRMLRRRGVLPIDMLPKI